MAVGRLLEDQRAFLAVALVYTAVGFAAWIADMPIRWDLYIGFAKVPILVVVAGFLFWQVVRPFVIAEPGRPFARMFREIRRVFTLERALFAIPAMVLFPLVLSLYSSWKMMIPQLAAMDWDPTLAAIDRMLHGGNVWITLHATPWNDAATAWAAGVYYSWFAVIPIFATWKILTYGPAREQFLVSSVLCWGVLGTLGAMAFASAGPVFYGRLLGQPDPFADLHAYLHSLQPWIYETQDNLWAAYANGHLVSFGKGLSAMPSLHVAVATINALAAWRSSRALGWTLMLYAALVGLASVHLGWHYAIDAYVGIFAAWAIWACVGSVLKLVEKPTDQQATASAESIRSTRTN